MLVSDAPLSIKFMVAGPRKNNPFFQNMALLTNSPNDTNVFIPTWLDLRQRSYLMEQFVCLIYIARHESAQDPLNFNASM